MDAADAYALEVVAFDRELRGGGDFKLASSREKKMRKALRALIKERE